MRPSILRKFARNYISQTHYGRPDFVGECGVDHPYQFRRNLPLASTMNFAVSTSNDIRSEFLSFFHERKHTLVAPSSVYPRHNEGSYFINAGMNQFKPLFLRGSSAEAQASGGDFYGLSRAANAQPCIRIGGRHDDLNDVGYDTSHHTMFEMLGNWSFGSYGREVACRQMWHFLTEVLRIPQSALYVTFFNGSRKLGLPADEEARQIWFDIGVSDRKLMAMVGESNFWRADDDSGGGLCGPSTEIHVDYAALNGKRDMTCVRCMIDGNEARVVELWNCVFITHRMVKSSNGETILQELPALSVDTGLGLERLASVMQGTMTTYDTDVFSRLLNDIHSEALRITGTTVPSYTSDFVFERELEEEFARPRKTEPDPPPRKQTLLEEMIFGPPPLFPRIKPKRIVDYETLRRDIAYRIVADHSRALSTAMRDGLLPGRQGVGLKLRHLIHRVTRAAILTGLDSATRPALLKRIIAQIPPPAPFTPEVVGPMARPSTPMHSTQQICEIIQQEVDNFIPRMERIENAFLACIREVDDKGVLSAEQLRGLQSGQYGEPVNWDMICAQARWYGLKAPVDPALQPKSAEKKSSFSIRGSFQLLRALLSRTPFTQDGQKYMAERVELPNSPSQHTYEVPPLEASLLALVHDDAGNLQVVTKLDQLPDIISSQIATSTRRLGLVFDQTNFFSPCGGQAGDFGVVRSSVNQDVLFDVQLVEKVEASNTAVSNDGWIVHWVSPRSSAPVIEPPSPLVLCPDSERRSNLMRNHTAQHLLNWAFTNELASRGSVVVEGGGESDVSIQSSSSVHHGSRVDPDRFSLRLTILEGAGNSETLVENAEARCRAAIEAKLPIVSQEADLSKVAEKTFVSRFPWETYPQKVRVVCVGGDLETIDEKINRSRGFYSAELCGGTHVRQTEDLVDVVIVGLRSRNQSVKEFIAISGESAVRARNYGSQQLRIISMELNSIHTAITKASDSLFDLLDCAERISTLQARIDALLSGNSDAYLSHLHRCAITRYQERLPGLLGLVKSVARNVGHIPENVDPLMVSQLSRLIPKGDSNTGSEPPIVGPFNISNFDKFGLSILHISPKRPLVLYQKGLAVFYHPEANEKAMSWAKAAVKQLDLGEANLTTRVEGFKSNRLGEGANHFVVVRLLSSKDKRQRDWKPYFNKLVVAVNESASVCS